MMSATPARKPYRKAPPQHRETRHAMPVPPPPPASQQPDVNQVKQHKVNRHLFQRVRVTHNPCADERPQSAGSQHDFLQSSLPLSGSNVNICEKSSLELCIPLRFSSQTCRPNRTRTKAVGVTASDSHATSPCHLSSPHSPANSSSSSSPRRAFSPHLSENHSPAHPVQQKRLDSAVRTLNGNPPKGILKQPTSTPGVEKTCDVIRNSKSVELLDNSRTRSSAKHRVTSHSVERTDQQASARPHSADGNRKMRFLEEKVRFSNFLDEITCRVLSPVHLTMLGRSPSKESGNLTHLGEPHCQNPALRKPQKDRSQRWDDWVAALQRPGSLCQPQKGEWEEQQSDHQGEKSQKILELNSGLNLNNEENRMFSSPQGLTIHVKVGRGGQLSPLITSPSHPCSHLQNFLEFS